MSIRTLGVGVLVLSLLASGCIAVGGNEHFTKPTLGRQLMDLKTARDTGAISDEEYRVAKQDLLNGRTPSASAR
jgi:hypothetical protein